MAETIETDEEAWSRIRDEKSSQHDDQQKQQQSWAKLQADEKPAWVKELNKIGAETL